MQSAKVKEKDEKHRMRTGRSGGYPISHIPYPIFCYMEVPVADYRYDEKEGREGTVVTVLGETYEAGRPEGPMDWRAKLASRDERVRFLRTALRYWYSDEWYGSEKRREEA
jgi:hypothetical protein